MIRNDIYTLDIPARAAVLLYVDGVLAEVFGPGVHRVPLTGIAHEFVEVNEDLPVESWEACDGAPEVLEGTSVFFAEWDAWTFVLIDGVVRHLLMGRWVRVWHFRHEVEVLRLKLAGVPGGMTDDQVLGLLHLPDEARRELLVPVHVLSFSDDAPEGCTEAVDEEADGARPAAPSSVKGGSPWVWLANWLAGWTCLLAPLG